MAAISPAKAPFGFRVTAETLAALAHTGAGRRRADRGGVAGEKSLPAGSVETVMPE